MDTIKALLAKYATPLFSKIILRGMTYGATILSAKLAIQSPSTDAMTEVANWGAAAACAVVAILIDYFQHKYNTK